MTMPPVLDPEEQRKRQLIALINARRGIYAPPAASPQVTPAATQAQQDGEPGGFLGVLSKGLKLATSGEAAANAIGGVFGDNTLGTDVRRQIDRIPVVGRPLAWAADVATSPLTIATAGFGGALGAGVRGATEAAGIGGFGRFAAPLVEPLVQGPLAYRVGAAVAGSAGTELAGQAADAAGLPAPLKFAAEVVGGAAGIRTVGNAAKLAARNAGGLTAEEVTAAIESGDPVRKFTAALSTAKQQRGELDAARSTEFAARTAKIQDSLAGVTDPEARARLIRSGQRGELPTQQFTADMEQIGIDDIAALKQRVTDHYQSLGRVYDEANATEALNKVFAGQIPTPSELGLLQNALGAQFAETVQRLGDSPSLYKKALELVGVPRAVMASVDLSIPFRQGALGVSRKAFWDSWRPMMHALGDDAYANTVREQLATDAHPIMQHLRDGGLITGLPTGGLAGKEEAFMSGLAEIIPGVKQSERAAVTFLNKFRSDYAKSIYDGWVQKGVEVGDKDIADLVKWTGLVSGRGDIPFAAAGRDVPVLLNSLFFSPRFISARLQALNPKTYLDMNPLVRKEAMRDMAAYFAPGAAALTALGLAGSAGVLPGVKVETDPRSSDFGKVQIGRTRLDPWGGFQPIARYFAQIVSGEAKGSDGSVREADRAITLGNFARSKLAPLPSFLVDAMQGTTFTGQEVDVTSGAGLSQAAASRLVPLLMQDMAEAIKMDGGWGAIKTAPAVVGFGVQTFNSRSAIQNAGAQEIYKKPWQMLTGEEQANVRTAYAEQLAKQAPPSAATISGFVDKENLSTQAFEQQLNTALSSGQINNRQFTQALQDRLSMRINRVQGVVDFNGADKGTDPTLLDRYFSLRDNATVNGIVDYQMLDQLQHNFMQTITPDEQRVIIERAGFQHAPEVQWWADAKKTIQDSGYYDQQAEAMKKLAPLLKAVGGEGLTYNQLVARAGGSDNPAEAIRLGAVIKRIDSVAGDLQTLTRLKNPELDKALAAVYGSTPLALRR